jgi:tetratricopeptide (TPR) repeat protein
LLADEQGSMDRQTWRPLLLAMEPHLVQRGSLWAFGHDFLRQAVADELVPTNEAKRQTHHALADFFATRYDAPIVTARMAAEAPWNAVEAKHWELARRLLNDLVWLEAICQRNIRDADIYWRTMEREKADCFVVTLRRHLDGPESALTTNRLDILCELASQYCLHDRDGRKMAHRAIKLYRKRLMNDEATNGLQLAKLELSQGGLLLSDREYDMAISCYLNAWKRGNDMGNLKLEGTASGAMGTAHVQKALIIAQVPRFLSLWILWREARKADKAFRMEYLAAIKEIDSAMAFSALHGFFGICLLLGKKGTSAKVAQQVFRMVEQESIADSDTLSLAYAVLGKSFLISGKSEQAVHYYDRAISCCRLVGNYYQLPIRLLDLAEVQILLGTSEDIDVWKATGKLCIEAAQILKEQNGRKEHLCRAHLSLQLVHLFQKSCDDQLTSICSIIHCWWRWKTKKSPFGLLLEKLILIRVLPIGLILGVIYLLW